jgi:GTPase involved in cell partitioning and DNA repair
LIFRTTDGTPPLRCLGELEAFSGELVRKPRIILGTKTDAAESGGRLSGLAAKYPREKVRGISVFSGDGLDGLAGEFYALAEKAAAK